MIYLTVPWTTIRKNLAFRNQKVVVQNIFEKYKEIKQERVITSQTKSLKLH